MSATQDRSDIERARRGDRRAFGALVTRHRDWVYGFACRMLGDREEAFDAAQEAFIRVWTALEDFDVSRPFRPWLLAITANVCTDLLRRRREQVSLDDRAAAQVPADPAPSPHQQVAARQTGERITAALVHLTDQQRLAVVLKHIQGLSYEEIAEMTGMPVNTIKSHVRRGRLKLVEVLGEMTEGGP